MNKIKNIDAPKLWTSSFFILFLFIAFFQGYDIVGVLSDFVNRVGMNGVLVLSMVPAIACGTGPNFGISIGIVCGLLGGCISIELGLKGYSGFFFALLFGGLFSCPAGYFYGKFLNYLKGNEMTAGTYIGFSVVSFMSIAWTLLPFQSPDMIWSIGGKGLRTTISLSGYFEKILNAKVSFLGQEWAFGTLLFFAFCCGILFLFFRTKTGIALKMAGSNTNFALASGIDVNKQRIYGTILSTILGAVGILVYSQSYGFLQLYQAPLMMPFFAVSAILIGGASISKVKISHAVIGVIFMQFLMTVATPVINEFIADSTFSDAIRMVISYSVILYALTRK